jgi:hypothetical protein
LRAQHFYFDGCNGQRIGDEFEGDVDECTQFLLDTDTDSGQYDPTNEDPEYHSLNDWTPETAKEALLDAAKHREPLYIDGAGDRQSWLIVTGS